MNWNECEEIIEAFEYPLSFKVLFVDHTAFKDGVIVTEHHLAIHVFFLQENETQKPKNFKKMLRKSPASNVWAAIFKNTYFS